MKYRVLTDDELAHFSEELKQFLIVNGIYAEEWEVINQNEPTRARQVVEIFSDTVLQRVYEKISFLEFRSPDSLMLFNVGEEMIQLISIQTKNNTAVDLSTPEGIHKALVNNSRELSFFKTTKSYSGIRESEVHRLLEQGCVPSSMEFWDKLEEVLKD